MRGLPVPGLDFVFVTDLVVLLWEVTDLVAMLNCNNCGSSVI